MQDGRPKKASGLSAVGDLAQVALAHAVGSSQYKELDIALVKATNHDPVVPKQKHVITIYNAVGRGDAPKDAIKYALTSLGDRVANASEWLVVLKCLMVVHRLMREAEGERFRTVLAEMLFGGRGRDNGERRRGGGEYGGAGLNLFNLGGFKDDSSPQAWEMSGWVRSYALYLEERCAVFADTRCDPQAEAASAPSAARSWSTPQLLQHLPRLQGLLRRLVDVLPRLPRLHPVAAAAAQDSVKEAPLLFRAVSDGIINLVDQFFDMPTHEATQALDMYRRAVRQVADLNAALRSLVAHEQLAAVMSRLTLPFDPPPSDFLKVMEDYINTPGARAAGGAAHQASGRTRATQQEGPPSPPVYTLTPALPPALAMPQHTAVVSAAAAPQFDLLGGIEELSLAVAPPPQQQQQAQAQAQASTDLFDLFSAPAAAQAPPPLPPHAAAAAPAPALALPAPVGLNKGLLDSLYDSAQAGPPGGGGLFGGASMDPFGGQSLPQAGPYRVSQHGGGPGYGAGGMPYGAPPPQQQQAHAHFFGAPQMPPPQQQPPPPYGHAQQPFGGYGAPPQQHAGGNPFGALSPPQGGANMFGGGGGFGAPPPPQQQGGGGMFGAPPPQYGQQAPRPPPSTNPFA